MSRIQPSRRPADATAADAAPAAEPGPAVPPSGSLSLGWRVTIAVWLLGFAVLFGYELWGFLWKVVKGMF